MIRSFFPLLLLVFSFASEAHSTEAVRQPPKTDFAVQGVTKDARIAATWVAARADNQRLPFVIVDKKSAEAFVFDGKGQFKGATPVLLGLALGDDGLTDMMGREVSSLLPAEQTTPAGRFAAEPGRNLQGDDIIWLDYAAQLAIHRLRPDSQQQRRTRRLLTPSAADNRTSLGCIVVPVAFYDSVMWPILGKGRSVVYVLPETRPLQGMLNALQSRPD